MRKPAFLTNERLSRLLVSFLLCVGLLLPLLLSLEIGGMIPLALAVSVALLLSSVRVPVTEIVVPVVKWAFAAGAVTAIVGGASGWTGLAKSGLGRSGCMSTPAECGPRVAAASVGRWSATQARKVPVRMMWSGPS